MIETTENFLREYKLAEKMKIYKDFEDNAYQKIHRLVMESIKARFGSDVIPLENVLHPRAEAFAYLKKVIQTYWNASYLDLESFEPEVQHLFEKRLAEGPGEDLLDRIANLARCNFFTYFELLSLDEYPFISKRGQNGLLSVYCIPIGDKYLVHAAFDLSEKFDYILLQEKFKSLVWQYPLTKQELDMVVENYRDIGIVIGALARGNRDFLEKNTEELYDLIAHSPSNRNYKKEMYLYRLESAMKWVGSDGSRHFTSVFEVDLQRKIDTSFYRKLNYSKVQNLVKEIIVENYLNRFAEKLAEAEKTYVYYCLFFAAYAGNAYQAAIQIGEYLLENEKIIKYKKELILNHGCKNGREYPDYFLKRYDTALLADFFTKLIDAYVKEKQFGSAMRILETYSEASSRKIRMLLAEDLSEEKEDVLIEQLQRDIEGDICILLTDYDYFMFDEEQRRRIIQEWHERIKKENFFEAIYKPLERHILNIIMTTFANGKQKLTNILVDVFHKYFTQSKEMFEQFYHFIIMHSQNEKLIDKALLNSLKKAEMYLAKVQQSSQYAEEVHVVKNQLFRVKKIYENSGTILNKYLTDKKMDALSSILREKLDEQTYHDIIDEVISEMKGHLDASRLKKEEMESYFERLKSIERLGSVWDKLEEESKINLATGMYLYDTQKAFFNNEASDFSATIINWCLAVENELKQKIYLPFKDYCESRNIQLRSVDWRKMTFGMYIGIFGYKSTELSRETFYDFCTCIYPGLSKSGIIDLVNELEEKLETARRQYRNKAAHPEILDEEAADACYDLFFPTQHLLRKLLMHYEGK